MSEPSLVRVELRNFPLQVFASAREHHDEMMREFAIIALGPSDIERSARAIPHRLIELTNVLGRRFAAAAERGHEARDAAIERGDLAMDLTYLVPSTAAEAVTALHDLMAEADEYCRSKDLLTLPASDIDRAFRDWFRNEFVRQLAGGPPSPWAGALVDA